MKPFNLVVAALLLLLASQTCIGATKGKLPVIRPGQPAVDALWLETTKAIASGNASEAVRLLRLSRQGTIHVADAELALRAFIASESTAILAQRDLQNLAENELQRLLRLQNEICSFKTASAEDWRRLLKTARAFKGNQQLIIAGEAFLTRLRDGLPVIVDDEWIVIFKDLESLLTRNTQALYRLQLFRILAGIEATAGEYSSKLDNQMILARASAAKVLGQADVAIALGDLDAARSYIAQVKDFDAQYPGLERAGQRLVRAIDMQRRTGLVAAAMREKRFADAQRQCKEIQQLDPNNLYARSILQQIEDAGARPPAAVESAEARIKLAVRRLENDLRKAELDQDVLQVRQLLKELLLLKSDEAVWLAKLAETENQIALSQLNPDENYQAAQQLFKSGRFAELHLFLNRNPGLMNSLEKMLQVWEMRLMANYQTGRLNQVELKAEAENIISRAGSSFFASFVLMKLALADNRMDVARVHFQDAVKLDPDYPGLRWPGWLLWMHGEGRPFVVVILIVVFFLMIQLLRPAFALYESTYWFRIGLLAKIFPSLALRSLEGCFGIYRNSEDRIRLFRLLVRCSTATGNSKKAALYSANLAEIAPGDLPVAAAAVAPPVGVEAKTTPVSMAREDKRHDEKEAGVAREFAPRPAVAATTVVARRKTAEPATEPGTVVADPPIKIVAELEEQRENLSGDALLNSEIESKIHETRKALFAELDAFQPCAEISPEWREESKRAQETGSHFAELNQG